MQPLGRLSVAIGAAAFVAAVSGGCSGTSDVSSAGQPSASSSQASGGPRYEVQKDLCKQIDFAPLESKLGRFNPYSKSHPGGPDGRDSLMCFVTSLGSRTQVSVFLKVEARFYGSPAEAQKAYDGAKPVLQSSPVKGTMTAKVEQERHLLGLRSYVIQLLDRNLFLQVTAEPMDRTKPSLDDAGLAQSLPAAAEKVASDLIDAVHKSTTA